MKLSLSQADMLVVQGIFKEAGREPTDVELEVIAQTWSEHCKHRIFNAKITHTVDGQEEVVDSLGLERFPLLGISQGGPVAIAYAVRHPEKVSHLILDDYNKVRTDELYDFESLTPLGFFSMRFLEKVARRFLTAMQEKRPIAGLERR